MEDELTLHRSTGDQIAAADLYAALRLRAEVFVVEQRCSEVDPDGRDLERDTVHLWLSAGGEVASYLRVLAEPDGGTRIGRVVTAPAHRGRRLAAGLVDQALTIAVRPVILHAQSHLVHVYARHGFEVDGEEFMEAGIPHLPMRLV